MTILIEISMKSLADVVLTVVLIFVDNCSAKLVVLYVNVCSGRFRRVESFKSIYCFSRPRIIDHWDGPLGRTQLHNIYFTSSQCYFAVDHNWVKVARAICLHLHYQRQNYNSQIVFPLNAVILSPFQNCTLKQRPTLMKTILALLEQIIDHFQEKSNDGRFWF